MNACRYCIVTLLKKKLWMIRVKWIMRSAYRLMTLQTDVLKLKLIYVTKFLHFLFIVCDSKLHHFIQKLEIRKKKIPILLFCDTF